MAIWKDGPLSYDTQYNKGWMRRSYEKVTLKFSYDSENITDEFINKVESFLLAGQCYGISKTPGTTDYIFVFSDYYFRKHCKKCGKFGLTTAIWKNGPLSYDAQHNKNWDSWRRKPNTIVALKCLHDTQNSLDDFINEVKAYQNRKLDNILKMYGVSQNPNTKDYIIVLEYAEGGDFKDYLNKNYEKLHWVNQIKILYSIIGGLTEIHQKWMVHSTGKQPFADCSHDEILAISIYKGDRPEINEKIAPKCYIDLMKSCWDMNLDNRPTSVEVKEMIDLFYVSIKPFRYGFEVEEQHLEIRKQFKESEEYRKANPLPTYNHFPGNSYLKL
ncbi:kinase-like domain-containing protein [Rhizophagus irregularis DAOM 181602=DAOM 197198]|nr:kinase-like domain-containing protein [Rhizophagus irregularis DAOM 181602=DAOM 197198]